MRPSRLLSLPERALVRCLRLRNRYPPLFFVGAPRSGTTVVVQHAINTFELAYFPNISKAHPRGCVACGLWGRLFFRFEPSYESAYGVVDGPLAPSDGWGIFHRWFPCYDLGRPVREERLYELRNIVRAFELIFDAPFANKNNANGARIPYLARLFPDALFVFVQRDMTDTVRSVLRAREAHGVEAGAWWGAAPPQFHHRSFASEFELAVHQTWGVDRFIATALAELPEERWIRLRYEAFCEAPSELIDWIDTRYRQAGVELRRRGTEGPPTFERRSHREAGGESRALEIQRMIERLDASGDA